jgi:hypothetical protein
VQFEALPPRARAGPACCTIFVANSKIDGRNVSKLDKTLQTSARLFSSNQGIFHKQGPLGSFPKSGNFEEFPMQ